jgi:integrase
VGLLSGDEPGRARRDSNGTLTRRESLCTSRRGRIDRSSPDASHFPDFKKAFRLACQQAGVPYGRQNGGITYRCTRNTAATDLRAAGMDVADAMKVLGHKTPSIFRRYNLGDTEALRERLTRANAWVRSLPTRRPVVPLRGSVLPSAAS